MPKYTNLTLFTLYSLFKLAVVHASLQKTIQCMSLTLVPTKAIPFQNILLTKHFHELVMYMKEHSPDISQAVGNILDVLA